MLYEDAVGSSKKEIERSNKMQQVTRDPPDHATILAEETLHGTPLHKHKPEEEQMREGFFWKALGSLAQFLWQRKEKR